MCSEAIVTLYLSLSLIRFSFFGILYTRFQSECLIPEIHSSLVSKYHNKKKASNAVDSFFVCQFWMFLFFLLRCCRHHRLCSPTIRTLNANSNGIERHTFIYRCEEETARLSKRLWAFCRKIIRTFIRTIEPNAINASDKMDHFDKYCV